MPVQRKTIVSRTGVMMEDEAVGFVVSRDRELKPSLATPGEIEGAEVRNRDDDKLGEIAHLVLDTRTGHIAYAILSGEGALETGDRLIPVPWRALGYDAERELFVLDMLKRDVEEAETFEKDDWPSMEDRDWADDLHDYYGVQPYWR